MDTTLSLSLWAALASALAALFSALSSHKSAKSSVRATRIAMLEHMKDLERIIEEQIEDLKRHAGVNADAIKKNETSLFETRVILKSLNEELIAEFMPEKKYKQILEKMKSEQR